LSSPSFNVFSFLRCVPLSEYLFFVELVNFIETRTVVTLLDIGSGNRVCSVTKCL
jgi:hypothetical protein